MPLQLGTKRNSPGSFSLVHENLASFHTDRFPKRKGSVFCISDKASVTVKGLEVYPWLLIPNFPSNPTKEDKEPTPKDFTDTHWHCKQHSSILHEKHLGTAFAFAITHVETFLQWLLVTKKQKGVGRGLVQVTGLHNIIYNHRTQRDQSCTRGVPRAQPRPKAAAVIPQTVTTPKQSMSWCLKLILFGNNKAAHWTWGLGLDLEHSQVMGICHWTVQSFTHPNLELVITRILWIFLCPSSHQIFAHFCLTVNFFWKKPFFSPWVTPYSLVILQNWSFAYCMKFSGFTWGPDSAKQHNVSRNGWEHTQNVINFPN